MTAAVSAEVAAEDGGGSDGAPRGERARSLDGLRGTAAALVVAYHVAYLSGQLGADPWGAPLSRLGIGRAVLFALSGYLLYQRFARASLLRDARPPAVRFLWQRLVRVLPAYWVLLAATLVVLAPRTLSDPLHVLAQVALLQTVLPGTYADVELPHIWSLSVEVAFYLVLPVVAALVGRWSSRAADPRGWLRRQLAACAVLAASGAVFVVLAHTVLAGTAFSPTIWLPYHLPLFAAGMALAAVRVCRAHAPQAAPTWLPALASSPITWVPLLGLGGWLATTALTGPRTTLEATTPWQALALQVLYTAGAALLVLVAADAGHRSLVTRLLGSRPLVALGQISYGVFLWHILVVELLLRSLEIERFAGGFVPLLVLTLGLTLVLAQLSWRYVERPAARWRDRGPGAPRRQRTGAERLA